MGASLGVFLENYKNFNKVISKSNFVSLPLELSSRVQNYNIRISSGLKRSKEILEELLPT